MYNNNGLILLRFDKLKLSLKNISYWLKQQQEIQNVLIDDTKNKAIKERFIDKINDEVKRLQKVFNEWIESPSMTTQSLFRRQCELTNGMKTVLTTFHDDIVSHKSHYYNDLLDGGVSNIVFYDPESGVYNFVGPPTPSLREPYATEPLASLAYGALA